MSDDVDGEEVSEAVVLDPLQELFGIRSNIGESAPRGEKRKTRTPVRYFASPPAELTPPPPSISTSTASRGTTSLPEPPTSKTTVNISATDQEPEWVLPQLPRSTTSRIIRGISPIEAGAARAIPAPKPLTTTDDMPDTGGPPPDADMFPQTAVPSSSSNTACANWDYNLGETPTAGANDIELQDCGFHSNVQTDFTLSAGETLIPAQDLQDYVRPILEPLPPGWVHGQGFVQGLHPSADVFEDAEIQDQDEPQLSACDKGNDISDHAHDQGEPQQSACDKGDDPPGGDISEPDRAVEAPCDKSDPGGDFDPEAAPTSPVSSEQAGDDEPQSAVPEPTGAPPMLTAQQRARLHELLSTRDANGRVPYGLDRCADDASMWAAYRQGMKAEYRALRKRKRAAGTWDKDDHRGWGPQQRRDNQQRTHDPGERRPPRRQDSRSPLPRRRTAASSR